VSYRLFNKPGLKVFFKFDSMENESGNYNTNDQFTEEERGGFEKPVSKRKVYDNHL
jgi:hypothetical protein